MNNIQMNVEMAKAILDGRKVQTRRVVTSHIDIHGDCTFSHKCSDGSFRFDSLNKNYFATIDSKYKVGETIWVREPARATEYSGDESIVVEYLADREWNVIEIPERFENSKWVKNCQGIPNGCIKEMARIFLKITNVRVERLQDISEEECKQEGISKFNYCYDDGEMVDTYLDGFKVIWNKTAPKGYKWEDNPYVFVYEFKIAE